MFKTKPPCPPEGKYTNNLTDKKRVKHPNPRGTEIRRLRQKPKVRNSKPRPTSMVGAVTYNIISSTLGQEPRTSFPGRWIICSSILGPTKSIVTNKPSIQRNWKPYPTQRCQQSPLTRVSSVPIRTQRWPTSKRGILKRLSVINRGRRMCTKLKWKRSTIL